MKVEKHSTWVFFLPSDFDKDKIQELRPKLVYRKRAMLIIQAIKNGIKSIALGVNLGSWYVFDLSQAKKKERRKRNGK